MTIEQAVYERLLTLSPVTALAGTRIRQLILRQGEVLPAVRLQKIGTDMVQQHQRGPLVDRVSRIQIDAFVEVVGEWYTVASQLMEAIHGDGLGPNATGIFGFSGVISGLTVNNVRFAGGAGPHFEHGERRIARLQRDYFVDWKAVT